MKSMEYNKKIKEIKEQELEENEQANSIGSPRDTQGSPRDLAEPREPKPKIIKPQERVKYYRPIPI